MAESEPQQDTKSDSVKQSCVFDVITVNEEASAAERGVHSEDACHDDADSANENASTVKPTVQCSTRTKHEVD